MAVQVDDALLQTPEATVVSGNGPGRRANRWAG